MNKLLFTLYCSLLTITCSFFTVSAQDQHLIDSLSTQLKTTKEDTTKVNILNKLSIAYADNNIDKGIEYAEQALKLSERIDFKKGIGNAYNYMGLINTGKAEYKSGLEFLKKALKIREEINDKNGIAGSYNNIGLVYMYQDQYPEALKNFFAALKMNEETGNKQFQTKNLTNIGTIYYRQGDHQAALKNHFACLKIAQELDNKQDICNAYGNIGTIYSEQGDYPAALKNFFSSLKIAEERNDKFSIAALYGNIGQVYSYQKNYSEALSHFLECLKIAEEIDAKMSIARTYHVIGVNYIDQKIYNNASEYLNKGLQLSHEIGYLEIVRESYKYLVRIDSALGNFKNAFEHNKLYNTYKDSLLNNENTKKITEQQMQYDFDKKELATKAVQEKKDIMQRNIRNSILTSLLGALIFGMVVYRQRNKISKARKRSDELLLNILPEEVAEELKAKGEADAKQFDEVTVMFTDFKGFTQISEKLTPKELVNEIHTCFKAFDEIIAKHNIEKIKTIGDAYMCAGGLPVSNTSHADDVVKAAIEIQQFMMNHIEGRNRQGKEPFEMRIGIHTGPVVAGIVGVKKFAYDIWGDTVNTASRMESSGQAGKINISGATFELVKEQFSCSYRGKIEAKNKGEIDMYFVESSTNA